MSDDQTVSVLLCTYNGAKFLGAQLDSIRAQTHADWRVWASDDGSTDDTPALLARYQQDWGADRLVSLRGPANGFIANFLSLACNPEIQSAYYAYADQDDMWEPEKFARALAWVKTVPADVPALYCARTRLVDEAGNDTGMSPLFTRPPCFKNALVQSIAGGNTMVFNRAARALLMEAGPEVRPVSHDWWTYQLVTGCGGVVHYDPVPSIRYRQHGHQVFGSNVGLRPRLSRAALVLFSGRFKNWTDINTRALAAIRHRFTPENEATFALLHAARTGSLISRLAALQKSGIHRQGFVDNVGLYTTVLLNRL